MNLRKRKFDSLTDLKEFFIQEQIETSTFNGYSLATELGVFGIAGDRLFLNNEVISLETLSNLITNARNARN